MHCKLLNAEDTTLLTTSKVEAPAGLLRLQVRGLTFKGTRCFGHNGGAPGMNNDLKICPAPGFVIAVLANTDFPSASRIADFIANRLPNDEVALEA